MTDIAINNATQPSTAQAEA